MLRPGIALRRILPVVLLVALLAALPAAAQPARPLTPLGGEPPTLGVRLDSPSLVGGLDATGLEVNPGALGMLPSWALLLRHVELMQDARFAGRGDAVLAASPLPFLSSVVVGAGLQWLRPPDPIGYADTAKISLGLAYRYQNLVSLGLAYHAFIADEDSEIDGLQSLDLGLSLIPFEWLGAGLAVRNVNTPVYHGLPLQREYALEVALRPLRTNRLELAAGLRLGERRLNVDPHLRIEGEPLAGLRLFTQLELLQRDFDRTGDESRDVRVTAGLGVHLQRVGLALSTMLGRDLQGDAGPLASDDTGGVFQGAAVTLRFQGARQRPVVALQRKILHLELGSGGSGRKWVELIGSLHRAERRKDIAGVLLEINGVGYGWAHVQELRRWMARLRSAGKQTVAYVRTPDGRGYYLASATGNVLLDPSGSIQLQGLAMHALYFRGLLDKVGIEPQFVRIAQYKGAPEQYTRTGPSKPATAVQESLLNDLYGQLLHDLAQDRSKSVVALKKLIDSGPFTPPLAQEAGLVDALVPPDKMRDAVSRAMDAKLVKPNELPRATGRWPGGAGVAVVLVEGDIIRGKSTTIPLLDRQLVGDETVAQALRWARASSRVKAVVIRVDSPGGSAIASYNMWREALRTAATKPVVISMGDIAASGGYYVAAAGHHVFAEPATLTGSIGIFSGKLVVNGLLDKLGINVSTTARGKRATLDSPFDRYSAKDRAFVLSRLQYYYRQFLAAVASGRKMTQDEVHAVARGRVWTGKQALGRNLVDQLGGLTAAIARAKQLAGLPVDRPAELFVLPQQPKNLLQWAAGLLGGGATAAGAQLPAAALQALRALPPVLLSAEPGEPLARVPYEIQLQ